MQTYSGDQPHAKRSFKFSILFNNWAFSRMRLRFYQIWIPIKFGILFLHLQTFFFISKKFKLLFCLSVKNNYNFIVYH